MGCCARRTARGPRLGLREVPQNRVHDIVINNERDDPHLALTLVASDFSPEIMATTASIGCTQPIIEIAWGSSITLSLPGSYDSYLWITGETTPTIDIDPLYDQW